MEHEYTLSIIKPDATKRNLIGKITSYLEAADLKIIGQKMVILGNDQAEEFYAEHKERSFFHDFIQYMTSGPIVILVLKGKNAVKKNREIMGATNPLEALPGTIRKDFGISLEANSIHGSDSKESAEREIALFFDQLELVDDVSRE